MVATRTAGAVGQTRMWSPASAVAGLSWLIAALAVPAATIGLLWRDGGDARAFTTLRGEVIELYGRGLYRHDTLFAAGGAQGNDAVVLLLGVPLLLASTAVCRRGSARWRLLHTGVLSFFLYIYASAALGTVAFNPVFPLYVALFSASLFAVVLSFQSAPVAAPLPAVAPRRGLAAFLALSGLVTLVVWGLPLAAALGRGASTERLDSYATEVTFALDLATITPLLLVAAALVLGRNPLGYRLAVPLLVLETMLAPMIAAQTAGQLAAGVTLEPGEVVGPVGGFVLLAGCAAWFTATTVRHLTEEQP